MRNYKIHKGGLRKKYKIRKGVPRKKYVCKEGGCQKIFLSSPPYFFFSLFGIALTHCLSGESPSGSLVNSYWNWLFSTSAVPMVSMTALLHGMTSLTSWCDIKMYDFTAKNGLLNSLCLSVTCNDHLQYMKCKCVRPHSLYCLVD